MLPCRLYYVYATVCCYVLASPDGLRLECSQRECHAVMCGAVLWLVDAGSLLLVPDRHRPLTLQAGDRVVLLAQDPL